MNPKIKFVCPECGSDNVTHDAETRWNVQAQAWQFTQERNSSRCNSCGVDFGGSHLTTVELDTTPETSDLGHLIADKLGAHDVECAIMPIYGKSAQHGDNLDGEKIDAAKIDEVDLSDPDNLIVTLEGGQQFTVRIIAGAKS